MGENKWKKKRGQSPDKPFPENAITGQFRTMFLHSKGLSKDFCPDKRRPSFQTKLPDKPPDKPPDKALKCKDMVRFVRSLLLYYGAEFCACLQICKAKALIHSLLWSYMSLLWSLDSLLRSWGRWAGGRKCPLDIPDKRLDIIRTNLRTNLQLW